MGPGDAIYVGFADLYVPESQWDGIKVALSAQGNVSALIEAAQPAPEAGLATLRAQIDHLFASGSLAEIVATLQADPGDFAQQALAKLTRNAPLSMAFTLEMLNELRAGTLNIRRALELEYRFTSRAMEHGDFIEGIRAAIIDKDKSPKWSHDLTGVPQDAVAAMMQPVEGENVTFERRSEA